MSIYISRYKIGPVIDIESPFILRECPLNSAEVHSSKSRAQSLAFLDKDLCLYSFSIAESNTNPYINHEESKVGWAE